MTVILENMNISSINEQTQDLFNLVYKRLKELCYQTQFCVNNILYIHIDTDSMQLDLPYKSDPNCISCYYHGNDVGEFRELLKNYDRIQSLHYSISLETDKDYFNDDFDLYNMIRYLEHCDESVFDSVHYSLCHYEENYSDSYQGIRIYGKENGKVIRHRPQHWVQVNELPERYWRMNSYITLLDEKKKYLDFSYEWEVEQEEMFSNADLVNGILNDEKYSRQTLDGLTELFDEGFCRFKEDDGNLKMVVIFRNNRKMDLNPALDIVKRLYQSLDVPETTLYLTGSDEGCMEEYRITYIPEQDRMKIEKAEL